jgi:hypothetical protein
MNNDDSRDRELDDLLKPLQVRALSKADLDAVLNGAGINVMKSTIRSQPGFWMQWKVPMAFAAGLAFGIFATFLLLKFASPAPTIAVDDEFFEEFATVRYVHAN